METNQKYPSIDITQCPNCGSSRRLSNEVTQDEIRKGKLPKDSQVFLFQHQSIIAGTMAWLSAPMILSFFDVCVECGTVYCFHAKVQTAVQGGKNMPKAGGQFSGN